MTARILSPGPRRLTTLPELARHERVLACTRCRMVILVCGWVLDIDPATYVGVACGCRAAK